jgi:hypothetical protein
VAGYSKTGRLKQADSNRQTQTGRLKQAGSNRQAQKAQDKQATNIEGLIVRFD